MPIIIFLFIISTVLNANESFSGTVISQNLLKISSRYMGYIKDVNVNEGEHVNRGELLYSIDSKEIDNTKSQVLLSLEQAMLTKQMHQNQYNQSALILERYKRLFTKKMVAKIELENIQLQVENLKALLAISDKQIEQINVRLKDVEHQYKYLHITAPTDGVIVQKSINQGDIAIPGMPALIIADLEDILIEVDVTESSIVLLNNGMEVSIEIPSIEYKTKGKIQNIIPFSNTSAHRFKIKIIFTHEDVSIYPGMYAKITIDKSK